MHNIILFKSSKIKKFDNRKNNQTIKKTQSMIINIRTWTLCYGV